MSPESSSNDKKKSKQRPSGRRRDYVDSFRWGFVPEEESGNAMQKPNTTKPDVKKPNPKEAGPPAPTAPAEVAAPNNSKRSRRQKKAVKGTVAEPATKPQTAPKKDGSNLAGTPSKAGKRPPKSKGRTKAVLPSYVADSKYEELDEDLKLPSYGRTPVPTDDELPVPQKIQRKSQKEKSPAPIASPPTPGAVVPESIPGGFRPRREQMVWDPDKLEYVPLVVVPEKDGGNLAGTPSREAKPTSKQQPAPKKKATADKVGNRPPGDCAGNSRQGAEKKDSRRQTADSDRKSAAVSPTLPPGNRQPAAQPRPSDSRRHHVPKFVETSQPDPADIEAEVSGFAELGVSKAMLEALKIVRYLEPTPIQAGVFQKVQAGVDLMGQAQTGTGKTAAFSMPIIEGVETCPPGNDPVALILVPTRELAVQVRDEATRLAYGRDIRITACYGGKPLGKQIERLKSGIDILIGTPGRILDLMRRMALSLDSLRWIVLDEADRMLDIGFRPDIEKILRRTPQDRQTLLFSATLPQPVIRLAEKYMKSPEMLDFSSKSVAVETIDQYYVTVDPERKFDALVYLLQEQQPQQAIIFTRTKRGADRLARLLTNRFEKLAAIHGDLQQSERDKVMAKVRAGSIKYLVATDVVGRGIDVSNISHIINYDIPKFCDDYVHRVGRTGRMGREGVAFTFVTVQEGSELTRIEMRIDKLLKRAELKGFESFTKPHDPDASLDEEPPEPPKPVFGKPIRKVRRAL